MSSSRVKAFCREVMPQLRNRVSGPRILRDVAALAAAGRCDASDRLRQTTQTLEDQYRAAGALTSSFAVRTGGGTLRDKSDIYCNAGVHDVVSGLVIGRAAPQEEVWALAHGGEPGALDNASGVAVCVEIARILEALIAQGRLARPRRTIRLTTGYACIGAFAYLQQVRRHQIPLAGVCIGSVGARPDVCDGRLQWNATTPMTAGFVNEPGATMIDQSLRLVDPGYRLARGPFVSSPETLIADPKYGFPCGYLCTERRRGSPFDACRTSGDAVEWLSADGLAACAIAMAGYLYFLADAGTADALEWAAAETRRALRQLAGADLNAARADHVRRRHRISLLGIRRWMWGGEHREIEIRLSDEERTVSRAAAGVVAPSPRRRARPGMNRIPRRTAPLTPLAGNLPEEAARRIGRLALPSWTLYWADGQRSLSALAAILRAELDRDVDADAVAEYFGIMAELGYVKLMNPRTMIGRARLIADIRALGVRPGMDLVVHSSLAAVGEVKGGPDTVIDALQAAVGRRGTLLMPSFNHFEAHVYNPLTTSTKTGAIADAFWRRPQAVRSLQATHPVAAIGPKAERLCAGHLEAGIWGANSPLGKLIREDGWILSLGVDHRSSSVYHVAQSTAGSLCLDLFGSVNRVLMPDGQVVQTRGLATGGRGGCPVSLQETVKILERRGLCRHGRVGCAEAILTRAQDLWRVHSRRLAQHCSACPKRPVPRLSSPLWPDFLRVKTRRPFLTVCVTLKSASMTVRSAGLPEARTPALDPITLAGFSVAMRTASVRRVSAVWTMLRTALFKVRTLPASLPFGRTTLWPSEKAVCSEKWVSPLCRPPARMESVMRITPLGVLTLSSKRIMAGCTWTVSAISSIFRLS